MAPRKPRHETGLVGRTLDFDRFGLAGGRRLAMLFAAFALVATVLLSVVMPPFQNPDETSHMLRADAITHFALLGTRFNDGHDSGGVASPGIAAASMPFDALRFHPAVKLSASSLATAAATPWGTPSPQSFANTAVYPPVFYLPAAAGIAAARAIGLGIVPALKLARLSSALASVLIATLAVLLAGRAAVLIATILCLPMSLELLASVSQDGPMLACAALAGALLWRGASGRLPRFGPWFLLLCVALGCIVSARPPYLPLALLPFALRGELRLGTRLGGAALVLAMGLGWSWIALATSALDTAASHGAAIGEQAHALLLHPWRVFHLAWNTLGAHGVLYLHSFIGQLGWLDTDLPRLYLHVAMLALVAAALAAGARPAPLGKLGALLMLVAIGGAAGAVFLVQYLTWTPLGAPTVEGVQGRYFLPLALCAVPITLLLPRLGPLDRVLRAALCAFPVVSLAVMMRAIVLRYYLS